MRRFVLIGFVAAIAGCASSGTPSSSAATSASPRTGGPDLITQREIAEAGKQYSTAFEIIEGLRPNMMRYRAATMTTNRADGTSSNDASSINVVAFLDDVRLGGVEALRQVSAVQVKEIRYINSRDATTKWGTGYTSGVIQVISKK